MILVTSVDLIVDFYMIFPFLFILYANDSIVKMNPATTILTQNISATVCVAVQSRATIRTFDFYCNHSIVPLFSFFNIVSQKGTNVYESI